MRFFFHLLLLGAALLLGGCAAYGPPVAGEKIHRSIVYATPSGRPLKLDLYVPKSARPVPVVVWIFGGSWRFGKRGFHVNLRDLPKSGVALACIDYRLSGEAKFPAQLEDVQAALGWLRTHGTAYGLDVQRIGLSGESAGGHLAALAGLIEGRARVRAVCALYAPTDIAKIADQYAWSTEPSAMERLLGGPIEKKRALATQASPVRYVNASSPPFLLIHGDGDELVPLEHSRDLHRRLRAAGVASRLLVVAGKPHWFLLDENQRGAVARFFGENFR